MKNAKLFTLLAFLFVGLALQAQTEKSNVLIGGVAGFSSSSQGDFNSTSVVLSPMAMYFVADGIAVGGGFNLGFSKFEETNVNSYGIMPAARYYITNTGNSRIFGQAGVSLSSIKVEDNDAVSSFGWGLGVGLDQFLNDRVALEVFLGFDSDKVEDADDATNTFGLSIGVAAFIGGGK